MFPHETAAATADDPSRSDTFCFSTRTFIAGDLAFFRLFLERRIGQASGVIGACSLRKNGPFLDMNAGNFGR